MGFLTRCKRPFLFAFLLQFCNMLFSFFLKTFLILFEKQQQTLQVIIKNIMAAIDVTTTDGLSPEVIAERIKTKELVKYAVVVVSTVPALAIFPFVQKYFVKGVMVGAIKG